MNIYKKAGNGQTVRYSTDKEGNKLEDTKTAAFGPNDRQGTGKSLYAEYQKHLDAGGKVEDQYTPDELEAKEAEDLQNALTSQRSTLRTLLSDSDKKLVKDSPYSVEDQDKWIEARQQWRAQILMDEVVEIFAAPF